jgi:spore germination cell wall hydrolase CwlJ-like protein
LERTIIYRHPRRQAIKVAIDNQIQRAKNPLFLGAVGLVLMGNAGYAAYRVYQTVPPVKKYVKPIRYRGPTVPEMYRYPLATTVWMEARNQPDEGKRAVAHTIVNRVKADKDRWGHGLLGVVVKWKQFSCHNAYLVGKGKKRHWEVEVNRKAFFAMLKKPENSPEKRQWREIQAMTKRVWEGRDRDNSGGATHYATTSIKPYWRYDMTVIGIQYDHAFFREMTARERKLARRDREANAKAARARRKAAAKTAAPKAKVVHRVSITPKKVVKAKPPVVRVKVAIKKTSTTKKRG